MPEGRRPRVPRIGIFSQLLLAFLLVALIPLLSFWSIQSSQLAEAEMARAEQNLQMFSRQLVQQVDDWLELNLRVLQTAADMPGMRSGAPPAQQPIVDALARHLPWAYLIHSLDPQGTNVVRSDGRPLRSYAFRGYFRQVMAGALYAAEVRIGITSGRPALLMSVPVHDADQAVSGVLAQAATLDEVTRAVSSARFGQTGFAFLTTDDGQLIAHPHEALERRLVSYGDHPALRQADHGPGQVLRYRHEGRDRLAVVKRTRLGWIAVAQQDAAESLAGVHRANRIGLGLLAATIVSVLLLSLLVARGFARPLERVTAMALRISRGDLSGIGSTRRADQIGDLQRAMETMRQKLSASIREITRGRALLRATLENLPQGVSVIDDELRLLEWNRRYLEIFDLPGDLVRRGLPLEDILHFNAERGLFGAQDGDEEVQRRLAQLRRGLPHGHERELPDGTTLAIRGTPVPGVGYVTAFSDVTTYKNTERALRALTGKLEARVAERTAALEQARADAEQATRDKSRFLAAAIHDLTQPISAARMYASLLKAATVDADIRELAWNTDSALASIEKVFSGLMDLARYDVQRLQPRPQALSLVDMFDTLQREFGPVASRRGLRLDFRAGGYWVRSDPVLLYRAVQNLLSNALRYTLHGRVLVGVRRCADDRRIEVWDTGPGIPEHRQDVIFEEFRRLDTDAHPDEHGSGLGLAIVRNIARALNHPLDVRSWPGHGSVFRLRLPGARPAAAALPVPQHDARRDLLRGLRVWCVDDHAALRESTLQALQAWECEGRAFATSAAALQAAAESPAPDLLLLDYRIDELDGPGLYRRLVAQWGQRVPALLVSGESLPAAACDGLRLLRKPLDAERLQQEVIELLRIRPDDS